MTDPIRDEPERFHRNVNGELVREHPSIPCYAIELSEDQLDTAIGWLHSIRSWSPSIAAILVVALTRAIPLTGGSSEVDALRAAAHRERLLVKALEGAGANPFTADSLEALLEYIRLTSDPTFGPG